MPQSPLNFSPFYYPESAEELLTEPMLKKLMLGFTTGLGKMAVAMQDRKKRYDLFGVPEEYWCEFCNKLRKQYGAEQHCLDWDAKVARVLLGEDPGDYPAQAEEFRKPFPCHAEMVDMAEAICVGGRPFAVLHGGQIPPIIPGWQKRMHGRLKALFPRADQEAWIDDLIATAQRSGHPKPTADVIKRRHEQFQEFAREVETLLEMLYQHRRSASEVQLLKEITDALARAPIGDWWTELGLVLDEVCRACRLDRMAFLLGSPAHRFELDLKAASAQGGWASGEAKVGSFWEVVRHRPVHPGLQSWAPNFRMRLGIGPREPCAVAATTCQAGSPAVTLPAVLVCVGREVDAPGTDDFLRRLAEEIARCVSPMSHVVELARVRQDYAAQGTFAAHDVKVPLHAAFNLAEAMSHDIKRLGMRDANLVRHAADLVNALKEARSKTAPLDRLTVREMKIDCEFERLDVISLLDRAVRLAENLEPSRGIAVVWVQRPAHPVMLDIDQHLLSTGFHAILENAVKYSFERKEVRVYAEVKDRWFVLRVSDYGVGIPPKTQLGVFDFPRPDIEEEYRGRSRAGTGLGLPMTKRIIEAHAGKIELESTPPKGVTPEDDNYLNHEVSVWITLPLPRDQK